MRLYAEDENYKLYEGKMQDVLDNLIEKNSIDCIITDPPYELNFMNKGWDNSGVAFQKETWHKCFDSLKDGGYLLAFGGTRTYHRIACAIEDAGFEIRDCIMWLYGSGFPKSMNIGLMLDKKNGIDNRTGKVNKNEASNGRHFNLAERITMTREFEEREAQNEWKGWGTCLKPAYEPIIVARKPFKNSLVDNIIKNRIGGLNIDECRVGDSGGVKKINIQPNSNSKNCGFGCNGQLEDLGDGRFPANVILTYDETDEEDVLGNMMDSEIGVNASRYFYCAKANKKDRDEGLDKFEEIEVRALNATNPDNDEKDDVSSRFITKKKNIHPTVKPIELMQYLVRLVAPKNATILDCFMGSGSTGKAVMFENRERNTNYKFIGIEMTEDYLPICKARIDYAKYKYEYDLEMDKKKDKEDGVMDIFDFLEPLEDLKETLETKPIRNEDKENVSNYRTR